MAKKQKRRSKVNERSHPVEVEAREQRSTVRRILTAAEAIVPLEVRTDFDSPTLTRMNKNITAALAMLPADDQMVACVEEMSELTKVLCRQVLRKRVELADIQEEIADVYITVGQMARLFFEGRADFNSVVNLKLCKLESKLSEVRASLTQQ